MMLLCVSPGWLERIDFREQWSLCAAPLRWPPSLRANLQPRRSSCSSRNPSWIGRAGSA